jgi:predicted  nucleic acid-binding Zn-ribbon protein
MPAVTYTNERVDTWLADNGKTFRRLSNVLGARHSCQFECQKVGCGYKWAALPDNVIAKGSGCPKCAGNAHLTNEEVDEDLASSGRGIQRVGTIVRANVKIRWECQVCTHSWKATPNDIRNGYGCPNCAGNIPHTNNSFDQLLVTTKRQLIRVGDIANARTKIEWQCTTCTLVWASTPNAIQQGVGCPFCGKRGVNEKLIHQILIERQIPHIHQYSIPNSFSSKRVFRLDFFIPSLNLAIEYNGSQHYEPTQFFGMTQQQAKINFETQRKRDRFVRRHCRSNGIELIEIDGRKYRRRRLISYIEQFLTERGL